MAEYATKFKRWARGEIILGPGEAPSQKNPEAYKEYKKVSSCEYLGKTQYCAPQRTLLKGIKPCTCGYHNPGESPPEVATVGEGSSMIPMVQQQSTRPLTDYPCLLPSQDLTYIRTIDPKDGYWLQHVVWGSLKGKCIYCGKGGRLNVKD